MEPALRLFEISNTMTRIVYSVDMINKYKYESIYIYIIYIYIYHIYIIVMLTFNQTPD